MGKNETEITDGFQLDPWAKYPAMMSIIQVAEACGIHRSTVERWEASGRMPRAVRRDRFIRFRKSDIVHWINCGCKVRR